MSQALQKITYCLATMAAERYTPELAEAINAATATPARNLARISATPQPGQVSLAQLAEGIREHPAPAGAIVVVEDAATANPAHLAAVATALGPRPRQAPARRQRRARERSTTPRRTRPAVG